MPNLTLANLVRSRREALGLSRPNLAEASGVSVSTIVRIELRGHVPAVFRLTQLEDCLDLPTGALLGAAGERAA